MDLIALVQEQFCAGDGQYDYTKMYVSGITYRYEPSWPVIPCAIWVSVSGGTSVGTHDYTRNQRDFALTVHLRGWEIELCECRNSFWNGHGRRWRESGCEDVVSLCIGG